MSWIPHKLTSMLPAMQYVDAVAKDAKKRDEDSGTAGGQVTPTARSASPQLDALPDNDSANSGAKPDVKPAKAAPSSAHAPRPSAITPVPTLRERLSRLKRGSS